MLNLTTTWLKMGAGFAALTLASHVLYAADQATDPKRELCVTELPPQVAASIAKNYPGWKIQQPSDLGSTASVRWHAEPPVACPGIARGAFIGKVKSYAIVIVSPAFNSERAKVLVFRPRGASRYQAILLDSIQSHASNYFIHAANASLFFDDQSLRRFDVAGKQVILLVDAGEDEYQADIYFWTRKGFHRQPVDH